MSTAAPQSDPHAGDPHAGDPHAGDPHAGELAPDEPLVDNTSDPVALERERNLLREINARPLPGRLLGYVRLSGPGWLQSALTLGGGSLAGSLYLGVIAGFGLLWLQPLAMVLGICMLSAIGYVTLSTGERPFRAINRHVNPALGWLWLLASGLANIVWSLPQYSLGTAALRQNLLPDLLGDGGSIAEFPAKLLIVGSFLALAILVTWSYGSGHWGVRLFEVVLKAVVGLVVLCFVLVVFRLTAAGELDWGAIFAGFIPDLGGLFKPAPALEAMIEQVRSADPAAADYWSEYITGTQRDKLMAAFATAVGINMTFLLPYSMLGRGWGREHRGLGIFDLATGMFVPFFLATTCVVIASATQFHATPQPGLATPAASPDLDATDKQRGEFDGLLAGRPGGGEPLPAERTLAATLVERDSNALSASLEPVFGGRAFADVVFGLGVLGMALSTITLLMLVSGFVVCEVCNVPATGWTFRLGTLLPCLGALGPFVWTQAAFYLAVPTSVFGLVLLPVAYLTFLLLMNRRDLLGPAMPAGGTRVAVNAVLGFATAVSFFAAGWAVVNAKLFGVTIGWTGLAIIAAVFAALLAAGGVVRRAGSAARGA